METYQWLLIIVLAIYMLYRYIPRKGITQITAAEAKQKIADQKIQFVDVRTTQEFRNRSVAPFRNIPLNELQKRASELDQSREIVLICASGARSNQAAKLLSKQGFTTVNNVKGGLAAWPR